MKPVLIVAYHFPPVLGSSGVQRTLNFCRYLPQNGWLPIVLTVKPAAYEQTDPAQLATIPDTVRVIRTTALDSSRHLSFHGKYFEFTARPDRFVSWRLTAIPAGVAAVLRYRPKLIYATYPITTALDVGRSIAKLTGRPFVADFRDLMLDADYPVRPSTRRDHERIEREICRSAARVVTTTPDAVSMLAARYPHVPAARWACVRNGYNEDDFPPPTAAPAAPGPNRRLTLIHSGLLDPEDRNAVPFLQALGRLKRDGQISADTLKVVLRASGHDDKYRQTIEDSGLQQVVELAPAIGYRAALAEMLGADGLLLFQGPSCNHLVPAKLYEYMRAGRPMLGLVDRGGESGRLMLASGISTLLPIYDAEAIAAGLPAFLGQIRGGSAPVVPIDTARQYSRQAQARELAALFDSALAERGSRR